MSQKDREELNSSMPMQYKLITYAMKEWGVLTVIVGSFIWGQIQSYQTLQYMQKDQLETVRIIAGTKEQLTAMRQELNELKTALRAYELRFYGQGNK